ncbi:MAG: hypothetical protein LBR77_03530 [Lachnospiraceae bacterium]|nr:hypothetical protein [Lachnospiraceae bacterium]
MKKRKHAKLTALVAAALFLVSTLAGCASPGSKTTTDTTAAPGTEAPTTAAPTTAAPTTAAPATQAPTTEAPPADEPAPVTWEDVLDASDGTGGTYGGGGGMPGPQDPNAGPTDITGLLALKQYVFEAPGNSAKTAYYGVYTGDAATDTPAFVVDGSFEGAVDVFLDAALSVPATGVSALISKADGTLTLTGLATTGNVVYYLTPGEGAYTTMVYVVNDKYGDAKAKLTFADGTSVDLTTYAPNMRFGDYTAKVGANGLSGDAYGDERGVFIGANRTLFTAADYGITGDEAAAVDWFLSAGYTNAGDSLTEFGEKFYVHEYAMAMYRLFQIVIDVMPFHSSYKAAPDEGGGMPMNDSWSDAAAATLQSGVWNGIYTTYAAQDGSAITGQAGGQLEDLPLLTNIGSPLAGSAYTVPDYRDTVDKDGVADMLGTGREIDVEYAFVMLYNALATDWSMLSEAGEKLSAAAQAAAAAFDGGEVQAPSDYSNAAKIYAVATEVAGVAVGEQTEAALKAALDGEYGIKTAANGYGEKLSKLQVVNLLYAIKDSVAWKVAPTSGWAPTAAANAEQFFTDTVPVAGDLSDSGELIAGPERTQGSIALIKGGSHLLTNSPLSVKGDGSDAGTIVAVSSDANTAIDGAALNAPPGVEAIPEDAAGNPIGFVYNATGRNAYYRFGVGSGMAIWGDAADNTLVKMTSTDGTLAIDAEGYAVGPTGNNIMSGGAFVAYGAGLLIENAVTYSSGQHLTNNLFNGTVHYKNAYEVATNRAYSSDFWGGYQVYDNSVVSANGHFIDEPTTLIVKNSVYDSTLGGTGFASLYAENSVLFAGTISFSNNTSGETDTAAATFVNSVVNSSAEVFTSVVRGNRSVLTLVDSDVALAGHVLATVGNHETTVRLDTQSLDAGADVGAYVARFDGETAVYLYGDNTITTDNGSLEVAVDAGSTLYVYAKDVGSVPEITNTGAGEVKFSYDAKYGSLTLK